MAITTASADLSSIRHEQLRNWIQEVAALTKPDSIYICDGSENEWNRITTHLVEVGTLVKLAKKPNSFWAASDPTDVARVEDRTFICSVNESDAGYEYILKIVSVIKEIEKTKLKKEKSKDKL